MKSGIYIPFYSLDSGAGTTSCLYSSEKKYGENSITSDNYYTGGCTNHNRFDLMEGEGDFEINTGENLPYYLNNATNSFYNWYSDKIKSMIIPTMIKLKQSGYARDYENLVEEVETTLNVVLPSWGEMYTGNDLNINYWYTNRWGGSSISMSFVDVTGMGYGEYSANPRLAIRPVITLSKNVYVTNGNGSANSPYILGM